MYKKLKKEHALCKLKWVERLEGIGFAWSKREMKQASGSNNLALIFKFGFVTIKRRPILVRGVTVWQPPAVTPFRYIPHTK